MLTITGISELAPEPLTWGFAASVGGWIQNTDLVTTINPLSVFGFGGSILGDLFGSAERYATRSLIQGAANAAGLNHSLAKNVLQYAEGIAAAHTGAASLLPFVSGASGAVLV